AGQLGAKGAGAALLSRPLDRPTAIPCEPLDGVDRVQCEALLVVDDVTQRLAYAPLAGSGLLIELLVRESEESRSQLCPGVSQARQGSLGFGGPPRERGEHVSEQHPAAIVGGGQIEEYR